MVCPVHTVIFFPQIIRVCAEQTRVRASGYMLSTRRTGGSAAGPVVPEYFMTRTERTDV